MDLRNLNFVFAFLSAIGCCAGQQAPPSGIVNGMLGGNVTLYLTTAPSPLPDILTAFWTFADSTGNRVSVITYFDKTMKIPPKYINRVSLNLASGSLTLSGLTLQDSGTYDVTMIVGMGDTLASQQLLKVYEPVSEVSVTANVTNPVEFNDTVSLMCSAQGSDLFFTWLNGSSEIVANQRMSLSNGNRTLTISNIRRSESGPLTCSVHNVFMTRSAVLAFNISYGPENVLINVNPQIILQTAGSNLTLNCSAQSSPAATFEWAFNGTLLNVMGPVLKLDNVASDKSGNYTCRSSNSNTLRYTASNPVQLIILEKIAGSKIIGPTTPLIAGISSANLTCQVASGSVNTREWLKDWKPLSLSDTLTMSADKTSIFISPVTRADSGKYNCKMTNPVSAETASYHLVVNYGPELTRVEGKHDVEVGSPVELVCTADSVPVANFSWAFNGTATDKWMAKYFIEHAAYTDTGTYTCVAKNGVTGLVLSHNHTLIVKEKGSLNTELSGGAIVGIIIGVLVGVILISIIAKSLMKKRKIESPY